MCLSKKGNLVRLSTKAIVLTMLSGLFALLPLIGYTTNTASATTRSPSIAADSHMPKKVPDFSRFVGFWYAHGADLLVNADGQAHFGARTYTWCGPGVKQPCDSLQGGILDGYTENIQFSRVSGNVAYGTITAGNVRPIGSGATLTLLPGNQLHFSAGIGMGNQLCGPQAAVGACGA
jgi:hypothetical protein